MAHELSLEGGDTATAASAAAAEAAVAIDEKEEEEAATAGVQQQEYSSSKDSSSSHHNLKNIRKHNLQTRLKKSQHIRRIEPHVFNKYNIANHVHDPI